MLRRKSPNHVNTSKLSCRRYYIYKFRRVRYKVLNFEFLVLLFIYCYLFSYYIYLLKKSWQRVSLIIELNGKLIIFNFNINSENSYEFPTRNASIKNRKIIT